VTFSRPGAIEIYERSRARIAPSSLFGKPHLSLVSSILVPICKNGFYVGATRSGTRC